MKRNGLKKTRSTWRINPVERVKGSKKTYDRKKQKQRDQKDEEMRRD